MYKNAEGSRDFSHLAFSYRSAIEGNGALLFSPNQIEERTSTFVKWVVVGVQKLCWVEIGIEYIVSGRARGQVN